MDAQIHPQITRILRKAAGAGDFKEDAGGVPAGEPAEASIRLRRNAPVRWQMHTKPFRPPNFGRISGVLQPLRVGGTRFLRTIVTGGGGIMGWTRWGGRGCGLKNLLFSNLRAYDVFAALACKVCEAGAPRFGGGKTGRWL